MRFCPKCGTRLVHAKGNDGVYLICRKCSYKESPTKSIKASATVENVKTSVEKPLIQVVGDEEIDVSTLPTIKILCTKCGNDTAVWWMLQTRSADEPTTQFYRCVKCNHTWRHYA